MNQDNNQYFHTNQETLKKEMENNDIFLTIKKKKATIAHKDSYRSGLDIVQSINEWFTSQMKVSLQDKLIFFQLLSATHNAGITLQESLSLIGEQTQHKRLRSVIFHLRSLIEEGYSFAESLQYHSDIFDKTIYTIIEAGEKSGKLDEVLNQLVEQYERMSLIRKKVSGMLVYPVMVVIVMVLAAVVVLIQVVPQLMEIFKDVSSLPIPTQILIASSELLQKQWVLISFFVMTLIGGFLYWKQTRTGGKMWTRFVLHIPVIKDIYRGMILSRFSRMFGFLITAGVPIIEVLKLTAKATNNPLYEEKILLSADDLSRGISIAENISDAEYMFPNMFVKMVAIGEKSASTSEIMIKIALYYEDVVERTMKRFSTIMEPIILIVIAIGVVFMIMAIYVPILQINDLLIQQES